MLQNLRNKLAEGDEGNARFYGTQNLISVPFSVLGSTQGRGIGTLYFRRNYHNSTEERFESGAFRHPVSLRLRSTSTTSRRDTWSES